MFGKDKKPQPVFDSHFWHWYVDSYARIPPGQLGDPIPYNKTKYYPASSSVVTVQKYFDSLHLPIPPAHQVIALLKSPFTQGDLVKTFHLIRFFQLSADGLFLTNSGQDKLGGVINYVGAENWENVMCYLDALLFSMFANLESFEPILFISNQTSGHLVDQLASLIRLYVNLLRSGNLITTDLTTRICEVLEKLGFKEAMSHKQQDSAAIFDFLTETLSMPLLTFKIDIKHGGKFNKEDDEKISKERILFVSIPDEDDESYIHFSKDEGSTKATETHDDHDGILLEECLEHYFNNSISVKRELERRATLESLREGGAAAAGSNVPSTSVPSPGGEVLYYGGTIPEENSVTSFSASEVTMKRNSGSNQIDNIEETISLRSSTPISRVRSDSYKGTQIRYATRTRSSTISLWSMNENDPTKSKEVSLPAWMFLRLLPFYTDDNNMVGPESIARNSKEFVNRRPILPICLKRYSYDSTSSSATRSKKRIIIPPFIDLPQFVADDVDDETPGNYRLILESAVCHRGNSINSGHFISAVRKDSNNVNMTDEEGHLAKWYLYDDMKKKSRIVEKTFAEIFNTEWPYMLFYRLVTSEENLTVKSSPIVVPHGSKPKYWSEENLSPIISASNTDEESRSLKRLESAVSTTSSIPIPDIPPTDSRSVDVRQRYYWYVVDKDKNYYKELPSVSKYGASNGSITLSPQFRRNSQWSEKSNVSSIHNLMHSNVNDAVIEKSSADAVNERLKDVHISSPKEDKGESKVKKSPLTSFLSPTSSQKVKPSKSPKTAEKATHSSNNSATSPRKSPSTHPNKSPIPAPKKSHHHGFHRKSKKSEEYKKDKCIIT